MRYAAVTALVVIGIWAPGAVAKTFAGVVPDIPTGGHVHGVPRAHIADLPYGGGPVMHSNRTHVIFWQPAGSGLAYDPGYMQQVGTFLQHVARDSHKTTNVYSLTGQYRDATGAAAYDSRYAGAVLDTSPLPVDGCEEPAPPPTSTGPGWGVCLSDEQLMAELRRVTSGDHLPVTPSDLYVVVLPNGFGVCEGVGPTGCALGGGDDPQSFCGYHSNDPDGALLYAVIPYNAVAGHCQSGNPRPNASTADPTISTISHEHNEAITDPTGFSWIDGSGNENGDLCIDMTAHPPPTVGGSGSSRYSQVIDGGHYWLQDEWSNADHGCRPWARPDSASFQVPVSVRAGRTVRFAARARAGQGFIKAFNWFFGAEGQARGRSVTHTFSRAGTYRVILRVTDSWEHWAYAAQTVTVSRAQPAKSRASGRARRQHRR